MEKKKLSDPEHFVESPLGTAVRAFDCEKEKKWLFSFVCQIFDRHRCDDQDGDHDDDHGGDHKQQHILPMS